MRYEDASQASSAANAEPIARADVETLPAGSFGPASGNAVTGSGTTTGAAGADSVSATPATIVQVQGAGGATTHSGSTFEALGQYGVLSMDTEGNFNYVRNAGTPDGVQDVFNYTLADAAGANASTTLTIDIGQVAAAVAGQGVVSLPPGVEMSDIHVVGRDLVINMPDGTQMVIPGGAVFVPQLTIGDVEVPASNLAALLIDSEPQPAAGPPQSSGGNFADPVPPLDPGVPLGDLIPPTELSYTPPEFEEVGQFIDREPTVIIETPDNPAGAVNAVDHVDESGLPARGSEPEGTLEPQNIETTTGTIVFTAEDGLDSITIQGADGPVAITAVGQVIHGEHGDLTITGINLGTGQVTYTYTVLDNTTDGVNDFDDFSVVVTDNDGDVATATLHINIEDDEPIALDDTDSVTLQNPTTTGNVMTGADTTSGAAGADTVGADDATLTAVVGAGGSDSTFDGSGNLVVQGEFGTLTIDAEGNYTYAVNGELPENGGSDVFTYTLTDGDGDTATATLTITVPGNPDTVPEVLRAEDAIVDEDGLPGANTDANPLQTDPDETDSTESATDTGSILVDFKDDVPANLANAITLVDTSALDNQLQTVDEHPIVFSLESGQLVGRADVDGDGVGDAGDTNIFVVISITGVTPGSDGQATYTYQVELKGPVEHTDPNSEDTITLQGVTFQITDSDGDHATGTFDVNIVDDVPTVDLSAGSDANIVLETQDAQTIAGASDTDSSSANFGGIFSVTSVPGADGAASTIVTYTLGAVDGTDSGLTQTGDTIYLYQLADGSVVGSTATAEGDVDAANTVFSVTVDSDGIVTLTQYSQIDHPAADDPDGTDAPFADQSVHLDDGAITLTASATITDNDGDTATDSETVNIGANLLFDDDGPSVSNVQAGDGVNLDETTAGSPAGFPISDSSDLPVISATVSSGADTPASTAYGLTITGGSGTSSGLATAIGDHAITLVQIDSDTIEGQYTDGGTQVAFTIEMNTDGTITVTQNVPLEHLVDGNTPADYNDTLDLTGLVNATVTVTDYDGDTADGSAAIGGNIVFYDDGPSIDVTAGSDANIVLETQDAQTIAGASDTDSSSANFGGVFAIGSSSGGGDGAAGTPALTYTLGAVDGTDSGLTQTGDTIYLYQLADGSVVGSTATAEGDVDATNTVFSVTVDSDGIVTLTQYSQIDHPAADDPDGTDAPFADQSVHLDDGAITLTASATITDNDGDTATDSETVNIGANLLFDDDGPSVSNVQGASSITLDETSVGDITGWPATSVTSAAAMITATTSSGADTPATTTYGLALTGGVSSLASGLQTAQGDHAITLVQIDSDTIEGQYTDSGTQVAFTIQMNSDGTVTYTQNVPLEHSTDGNTAIAYNDTNTPITFDGLVLATITVTDYDGDTATGSTNIGDQITVFDDGPTAIDPDAIVTTDEPHTTITASLDIDDDVVDNFGADGPGSITFANVTDNQDSGLTAGGDEIFYWVSSDGQTVEGRTNSTDGTDGTLIFTVHIDQADSQYEYTQYATIDNGSGITFSDLSGGVAGNPPFKLITETGETLELLATPINGGSINSDQDDMGVDSQFIDTTAGTDQGIRLDFGNFTYVANAGGTADDQFTIQSHDNTVNGFKFTIMQVSNGTTADVHLVAYDADQDGGSAENTPNPAGDVLDPITEVKIYDNNGNLVGTYTADATIDDNGTPLDTSDDITIDFLGDGSVTIDNLPALYSIQTYTTDGYGRIEITNPGNDATGDTDGKFSIGTFTISETNTGDPVNLNFDLQVTDSDGDYTTITDAIDITLNPVGSSSTLSTFATTSSLAANSLDTNSLFSSNDNHEQQRAFNVGNNAALMGAIAAAGLAGTHSAAVAHAFDGPSHDSLGDLAAHSVGLAPQIESGITGGSQDTAALFDQLVNDAGSNAPPQGARGHEAATDASSSASDGEQQQAPTQLQQGTEAPAHGDAAATQVTAAAVAMPSAEQLGALSQGAAGGHSTVEGNQVQHNEVVGKVLADSLQGGAGPNIDALINALPGSGDHGHAALEALASHGAAAVSNGDMGVFSSFTGAAGMHIMEHMAMHHDAPSQV